MQHNKNLSYDNTKKMLDTIRSFKNSSKKIVSLNEQITNTDNDITVVNDVDVNISSSDNADLSLKDDEKTTLSQLIDNFYLQVSQIVDFEPGITISENQIRLDGNLTDDDINFVFISGNEAGVYINTDMLKLEDSTLSVIEKLIKFEETFKTSTESLINKRKKNI
jgi:hypothetical protein